MKIRMIATALLVAGISAPLAAQDMAQPPADAPTPVEAPPRAAPAPVPPVSQPRTADPASDPNAAEPAGDVPTAAAAMVPADPSVPQNPSAPIGSAANPVVMGGNMTAPPAAPKDYPVCTKTITDSCVNRGEKARTRR